MKIEYTDGCICTSLTVDGKETTSIDTTKVGTYKVKYEITYNKETYTLNRTIKVIKDSNNEEETEKEETN